MSDNNDTNKNQNAKRDRDNARSLLRSMGAVTWRMFAPPTVLVVAGLWADLRFATGPWLTIAGAAGGLALSVLLVRAQIRESK